MKKSLNGHHLLLSLGLLALFSAGCARTSVRTEIRADGTWKRTSKFYASMDTKPAGADSAPNPMDKLVPSLDQAFALPSGGDWKVTRAKENEESSYTAERVFKLGETLRGDIALKSGEKGKPAIVMSNVASISQVAPGKLMYREVLHWHGPRPKMVQTNDMISQEELAKLKKNLIQNIQKELPAELQKTEDLTSVTSAYEQYQLHFFYGPPEPMINAFLTSPDYAAIRAKTLLCTALDSALYEKFGEKLPIDRRYAIVRRTLGDLDPLIDNVKQKVKDKGSSDQFMGTANAKDEDGSMVILTYTVQMPGKVIESNGIVDHINNTVTWSFYNISASFGDVVLTATCEPEKK